MNINKIKTISLVDVCEEVNKSTKFSFHEAWDEVSNSFHGSQIFSNDTYFIYTLRSLNGEKLSSLQKAIAEVCKDAIERDVINFEVCW